MTLHSSVVIGIATDGLRIDTFQQGVGVHRQDVV